MVLYANSYTLEEESMLQKFKITSYTTLLLIGLFVFPSALNALDRDAEIDELNAQLISLSAKYAKAIEKLQAAVNKATEQKVEIQAMLDKGKAANFALQIAFDRSKIIKLNLQGKADTAKMEISNLRVKNLNLQHEVGALQKQVNILTQEKNAYLQGWEDLRRHLGISSE
jgi:chromosome segregation ATPase